MQTVVDQLAHLPIMADLPAIDTFFAANPFAVAIVAMEHHSGKSILLPAYLASRIGHSVEGPIMVLKHHAWQAIQAAEHLSQRNASKIGTAVSYLVNPSRKMDISASQVVFSTYTQALFSGLIGRVSTVVLDDVDNETIDLTITKAVLRHRATCGEAIKVVTLTAGLANDTGWEDWPQIVAEDQPSVEHAYVHAPGSAAAMVVKLVDELQNVLVFTADSAATIDLTAQIRSMLQARDTMAPVTVMALDDVESHGAAQTVAWFPPGDGECKIVIGSGLLSEAPALSWATAGVSTGLGHVRVEGRAATGGVMDTVAILTQHELVRQMARLSHPDSRFVLCHAIAFDSRPTHRQAEVKRLPLSLLVLRCAALQVDPDMLDFAASEVDPQLLRDQNRNLQRLGLISQPDAPRFGLTQAGKIAHHLSELGPETTALLGHAQRLDITAPTLVLAVAYEIGSIRKDRSLPHGLDTTSDVFDTARAIAVGLQARSQSTEKRAQTLLANNIDNHRLILAAQMLKTLEANFRCQDGNWKVYLPKCPHDTSALFAKLRQCILTASVHRLGSWISKTKVQLDGPTGGDTFEPSRGTAAVWTTWHPVTATKRLINPKNGKDAFFVVDALTSFVIDDFDAVNATLDAAHMPPLFQVNRGTEHDQIVVDGTIIYRGPGSKVVARPIAQAKPAKPHTVFTVRGQDKTSRLINEARLRKTEVSAAPVTSSNQRELVDAGGDETMKSGERASLDALQALAAHFNR